MKEEQKNLKPEKEVKEAVFEAKKKLQETSDILQVPVATKQPDMISKKTLPNSEKNLT